MTHHLFFPSNLFHPSPTQALPPNFMYLFYFLNPLSSVGVAGTCQGIELPAEALANYPGPDLRRKQTFLPQHPSLPTAPQPEWDFVTPSPTHLGILTGLVLRRSCACSHSHCEWAPCPEDIFFAAVPPTSGSDSLSTASSVMVPELWWRSRNTDVLFRGEYFRVSYYLWSNQLWISILNSIYCKKKKNSSEGMKAQGSEVLRPTFRYIYIFLWECYIIYFDHSQPQLLS